MPVVPPGSTVLVTGASGGVGTYIVRVLSTAGFKIRAAVRSAEKGEYVKTLGPNVDYVVVPDMVIEGAYDAAIAGVQGVVHVSSKPDVTNPGDPEVVVDPAVDGVLNLMAAVEKAGPEVHRVVLIGSAAAVSLSQEGKHDETEWNDEVVDVCKDKGAGAPPIFKYHASKVLQERAFWTFFNAPHRAHCDGVALLPAYVFGPPLEFSTTKGAITSSNAVLVPWVTGDTGHEKIEAPFMPYVAATDVATAAACALIIPEAASERFLLSAGPTFMNDFALAAEAAHVGAGVPKGNPDPEYRASLEKGAAAYDSLKARKILSMSWRDKDEVLAETMKGIAKVLHY